MSRNKRGQLRFEVRAILESPVAKSDTGRPIGAYEGSMRRAAEKGIQGKMGSAKRFFLEMQTCGLLELPEPTDDHRYVLTIPKEWDHAAWKAMLDEYGPPPWPGEHDGLVPEERWKPHYGKRPRRARTAARRKP